MFIESQRKRTTGFALGCAGYDAMPLLRVLYAHVAASCSNFADMLLYRQGLKRVRSLELRACAGFME